MLYYSLVMMLSHMRIVLECVEQLHEYEDEYYMYNYTK